MHDLPGQTLMPFATETKPVQGDCKGVDTTILPLPAKATVTPPEAARVLGVSARQVRYLVEEGVLLAIDVGRAPINWARTKRRQTPWRVVVRRGADFVAPEFFTFLTLEEFSKKRSNLEEGDN